METSSLPKRLDQTLPRSLGICAPVTQSAAVEGMAAVAQLPRLSSARANSSFRPGGPAQDVLADAIGMPENFRKSLYLHTNRTG
jgi:hypothetical protein